MSQRVRRKRESRQKRRTEADTYLPGALTRLENAIADLCEPVQHVVGDRRETAPSWLEQLQDARSGKRGDGANRASKPITELWLDAVMLLDEIQTAVTAWQPARFACHAECVSIPGRLASLRARSWRPQDVKSLDQISENLETWVKQISALLSGAGDLTLPNPCPECGKRMGHKIDSTGERVQCIALHVSISGAECFACHARWPADQLTFLGRLLDYQPPAGVLE